jgi:hypothetical protein
MSCWSCGCSTSPRPPIQTPVNTSVGRRRVDNDDAADWAAQFDGADQEEGLRLIGDALRQAAQAPSGGYLDSDAWALAVAAAELLTCVALPVGPHDSL